MSSNKNKDAYYFSHDSNAHQDEKILDLRAEWGWEGYGLFWGVVELMREQTNYQLSNSDNLYKKIALQLNISPDKAEQFLDFCVNIGLFINKNGSLYSESLLRRMAEKDKRSQQASKAAKVRWNNERNDDEEQQDSGSNADAMREHSDGKDSAVPKKEKKRKENYKKENTTNNVSDSKSEDDSLEYDKDHPALKATEYLIEQIKEYNPKTPVPKQYDNAKMQRWAKAMDRLNRIGPKGGDDGYTWDEIRDLIDWIFYEDEFWPQQIQSATGLREKVVKVENAKKQSNQNSEGDDEFAYDTPLDS